MSCDVMSYLVVRGVPITDEQRVLVGRRGERDRDQRAGADVDGAEATGGLVEC